MFPESLPVPCGVPGTVQYPKLILRPSGTSVPSAVQGFVEWLAKDDPPELQALPEASSHPTDSASQEGQPQQQGQQGQRAMQPPAAWQHPHQHQQSGLSGPGHSMGPGGEAFAAQAVHQQRQQSHHHAQQHQQQGYRHWGTHDVPPGQSGGGAGGPSSSGGPAGYPATEHGSGGGLGGPSHGVAGAFGAAAAQPRGQHMLPPGVQLKPMREKKKTGEQWVTGLVHKGEGWEKKKEAGEQGGWKL